MKRLSVFFEDVKGENGNLTLSDLPDTVNADKVKSFLTVIAAHSNACPVSFKLSTSTVEGTYVGGTTTDAKHNDVDDRGKFAFKVIDEESNSISGSRTLGIPAPKEADFGTDNQGTSAAKTAIGTALAQLTGETLKNYGAWLEIKKSDTLKVA
jgi:hypothetical protein